MNTFRYIAKSLPNDVILKSLNKSDLVQVQRSVHKKGKTFLQMFWIRPDKVRKTDHVVQGRENLHLTNAKAFKASGNKGNDVDEHYKFITTGDGANSITEDTKIEDGTEEKTKGKVINVVNQLSKMLADNIEESINQSKHIGSSDVDEWEDEKFKQTLGMTKEEYFKNHHIELPEHFHVEPRVQTLSKKRIRVMYHTSLDYNKVTEGTKNMLQAAFAHEQISGVEFRNVKGKLAIRLKVSNKGMYSSDTTQGVSKKQQSTKSSKVNTKQESTDNKALTKEILAQAAEINENLKPLAELKDGDQLEALKYIAQANELFEVYNKDGTPCSVYKSWDNYIEKEDDPFRQGDYKDMSPSCPWNKWFKSLTKEQKNAIKEYVSEYVHVFTGLLKGLPYNWSYEWNAKYEKSFAKKIAAKGICDDGGFSYCHSVEGYRIHCEGFYSEDDKPHLKSIYDGIHQAISKFEVKKPFITFRREDRYYKDTDLLQRFIDAGQGGVVKIDSVWSTSPIRGSYFSYTKKQIEYKIRVPAGKGIGAWIAPKLGIKRENEFLMDNHPHFRVVSDMKNIDTTTSPIQIELEYIGREDRDFDDIWEEARAKGLVKDKSQRTLDEEKKNG